MRSVSYLAIISGLVFIIGAFAIPYIAEWQSTQIATKYGQPKSAHLITEHLLEGTNAGRIASGTLAFFALVAGYLILRHRFAGQIILILVSVLFIVWTVYDLIYAWQGHVGIVLRGMWWLYVLAYSMKKNKACAQSWWNA